MTPEECRRRREAQGLSRERLAALAGLAERTVLRYEERLAASRYRTELALRRALQRVEANARETEPSS